METRYFTYFAVAFLVVFSFGLTIASAGIGDWIKRAITGDATFDTTVLNLTIGNTAPVITFVQGLPATNPYENGMQNFSVNFTAYDEDGTDDLNNLSAQARFQNSGVTRSNISCATSGAGFGNNQNYTCLVSLWYFDANAAWVINVTMNDSAGSVAENSTTSFTYNSLTAMQMGPTSMTWPSSLTITSANVGSNNDPILINNTGNTASTNISVFAIDLAGEQTASQYIYAGNFTVNTIDASDNTTMINGTYVPVGTANITVGNHSVNDGSTGQEQLYFYLEALNPDLTSQSYSTAGGGAWTVSIE